MREKDLPSPNIGSIGYHLRRCLAGAVSYIQANAYPNGKHPNAVKLSAFLAAAKAAVDLLLPVAPVTSFTPSAKSYSIADGAAQAGPVLAKGGSEAVVVYSSATPAKCTVDPATGAVTPLATGTSVITATFPASGGYAATTVTYTATVTA